MKRRNFLRNASAFFAALACSGPKILEQAHTCKEQGLACWCNDSRTVAYVSFRGLRFAPRDGHREYHIDWADGVNVTQAEDILPWDPPNAGNVLETILDGRDLSRAALEHVRMGTVIIEEIV